MIALYIRNLSRTRKWGGFRRCKTFTMLSLSPSQINQIAHAVAVKLKELDETPEAISIQAIAEKRKVSTRTVNRWIADKGIKTFSYAGGKGITYKDYSKLP